MSYDSNEGQEKPTLWQSKGKEEEEPSDAESTSASADHEVLGPLIKDTRPTRIERNPGKADDFESEEVDYYLQKDNEPHDDTQGELYWLPCNDEEFFAWFGMKCANSNSKLLPVDGDLAEKYNNQIKGVDRDMAEGGWQAAKNDAVTVINIGAHGGTKNCNEVAWKVRQDTGSQIIEKMDATQLATRLAENLEKAGVKDKAFVFKLRACWGANGLTRRSLGSFGRKLAEAMCEAGLTGRLEAYRGSSMMPADSRVGATDYQTGRSRAGNGLLEVIRPFKKDSKRPWREKGNKSSTPNSEEVGRHAQKKWGQNKLVHIIDPAKFYDLGGAENNFHASSTAKGMSFLKRRSRNRQKHLKIWNITPKEAGNG